MMLLEEPLYKTREILSGRTIRYASVGGQNDFNPFESARAIKRTYSDGAKVSFTRTNFIIDSFINLFFHLKGKSTFRM